MSLFQKLKSLYEEVQRRRKLSRQLDPESFRELSMELQELADKASKLCLHEPSFQAKLKRIKVEMEQLDDLASKPEFKRLSPKKRMELRASLMHSREQLLEHLHQAPSPTQTIQ
jgi:type I site-specific restriction-modification system R (restriction) subunit